MRLIDADKLPKYTGYALSANEVAMAVENAPTVDAVPVVRCGECKYYLPWDDATYGNCKVGSGARMKDWYCNLGERKDGEHD